MDDFAHAFLAKHAGLPRALHDSAQQQRLLSNLTHASGVERRNSGRAVSRIQAHARGHEMSRLMAGGGAETARLDQLARSAEAAKARSGGYERRFRAELAPEGRSIEMWRRAGTDDPPTPATAASVRAGPSRSQGKAAGGAAAPGSSTQRGGRGVALTAAALGGAAGVGLLALYLKKRKAERDTQRELEALGKTAEMALVKSALKYTRPNYQGSSFTYASDKELSQGAERQPAVRALMRRVPPSWHSELVRSSRKRNADGNIAGTIAPNVQQKRNIMMLSRSLRDEAPIERRVTLAHEAFHARTPVLGHSELAAHAYGGWKANKGAKRLWSSDGTGALNQLGHVIKGRPGRVALEAAVVGGLGYGAYRLAKRLRGRKKEETS